MKINNFFNDVLGANVRNPRWSWGAVEPLCDRIYLRVWGDQIETIKGKEFIPLDWDEYFEGYRSNGINERRQHVERLKTGTEGFGVVCEPTADVHARKIASFNDKSLLRLGNLITIDGCTLAEIVDRVPVSKLSRSQTGASTAGSDISKILRLKVDKTTKEVLVDARIGQGRFRQEVLNRWNRRCAVTGCCIEEAVRASHIKPWRESTNEERLDCENGLPLVATLDALFDAHLISFDKNGNLLVSSLIPNSEVEALGLKGMKLSKKPTSGMQTYLKILRAGFAEKESPPKPSST